MQIYYESLQKKFPSASFFFIITYQLELLTVVALLVVAVSFCPCDGKGDHCGGQAPRGNVVSPILASGTQQSEE